MRYIVILVVIILVFSVAFYVKTNDVESSVESETMVKMVKFEITQLNNMWKGPGLLHFQDTSSMMTLESEILFSYDSTENNYKTWSSISGHEYKYSDNGIFKAVNDSIYWDVTTPTGLVMNFAGEIRNNIMTLEYKKEEHKYIYTLYFPTEGKLYISHELFADTSKVQWLEFTLAKDKIVEETN